MRRVAALGFLAAALSAAPEKELLRDEAFNFRIVGDLPRGWTRRPHTFVWSFAVEGIPHAYVHFVRQRLDATVDAAEQLEKRGPQYAFPGAPKETRGTVRPTDWSGREAHVFVYEAQVQGILCRRRVTAMQIGPIWYELIETHYGEKTHELSACAGGLRVFRRGFRLLAEPLPESERGEDARTIADKELGFRIEKPKGFLRAEVDPRSDPGCRVAFATRTGDPRKTIRVRFFEYGTRDTFDHKAWFDRFFESFSLTNRPARRESVESPIIGGASEVWAERFTGERDKVAVNTLIVLFRSKHGRVFGVRIRAAHGAEADFADAIAAILKSITVE